VGFVPEAAFLILQVAENNMPPLPKLPLFPRRIARDCLLANDKAHGGCQNIAIKF
jgi:hypothetical protein